MKCITKGMGPLPPRLCGGRNLRSMGDNLPPRSPTHITLSPSSGTVPVPSPCSNPLHSVSARSLPAAVFLSRFWSCDSDWTPRWALTLVTQDPRCAP